MAACKKPLTSLTALAAYFSGFLACAHQLLWLRHKFEAAVLLLLVLVLALAVTTSMEMATTIDTMPLDGQMHSSLHGWPKLLASSYVLFWPPDVRRGCPALLCGQTLLV
jgi:uncharacterized membrane protein HdeD (DUF308 family)